MNDEYNLNRLIDCLQIIIIVCFFLLFLLMCQLSDIKGEFDSVIIWYCTQDKLSLNVID